MFAHHRHLTAANTLMCSVFSSRRLFKVFFEPGCNRNSRCLSTANTSPAISCAQHILLAQWMSDETQCDQLAWKLNYVYLFSCCDKHQTGANCELMRVSSRGVHPDEACCLHAVQQECFSARGGILHAQQAFTPSLGVLWELWRTGSLNWLLSKAQKSFGRDGL